MNSYARFMLKMPVIYTDEGSILNNKLKDNKDNKTESGLGPQIAWHGARHGMCSFVSIFGKEEGSN